MAQLDGTAGVVAGVGPWTRAARRLRGDRVGLVFAALLVLLVAACLAAPLYASAVAGTGPLDNHITDTVRLGDRSVDVLALDGKPLAPTWHARFLLGADSGGRDLAVRLVYGVRNSLSIAGTAALITIVLGTAAGLLTGYVGGRVDTAVMRLLDVVWSFPVLLAGIAVGATLTLQDAHLASKAITAVLIGVVSVPYAARPIRARVIALRPQPFVDAAVLGGSGPWRVMAGDLLPNLWFTLIALFTVVFANGIVLEAALSFLGAGVRPPEPSLGTMLRDGINRFPYSPHLLVCPTVMLTLTVLTVNLAGDAVRRALDPHAAVVGPKP